jgi:glutathione S-transferase
MALTLYYHPFSSYSWKVLIPLYEAGTPFTARTLEDPQAAAEWKRCWPIARFPVLVEEASGLILPEASIIVEYLDSHHPGPQPLFPADADLRLEARLLDRFFDNYVHASLQKIVSDRLRAAERRDAQGVAEAHAMLDTCYGWLDQRMADRE